MGALTAPITAGIDYLQGDIKPSEVLTRTGGGQRPDMPLALTTANSMQRTGGNLLHPSRYGKAIDEGRIVDTILEDVGNVSLVGGLAAKGLGVGARAAAEAGNVARAAALERAATGVERFAKLGGQLNDLPISAPRRGLQLAGRGIAKGIERVAEGEGVLGGAAAGLRSGRMATLLTPAGLALRKGARAAVRDAARAETAVQRDLHQAVTGSRITVPEQGAITAIRTGIADLYDRAIAAGLSPDEARLSLTTRDVPEQTFTADVAAVLDARRNGTLTPEQQARMDTYAGTVDKLVGKVTDRALAGYGRIEGPLDPRQMTDNAFVDRVNAALDKEGDVPLTISGPRGSMTFEEWKAELAADPTNPNRLPADEAAFARQAIGEYGNQQLLNLVLDNPDAYAARWRPAMRASLLSNAKLNEAGLPGLPVRPADMIAAGIESPKYLPGGASKVVTPEAVGMGRAPVREGMSGFQSVSSEKVRSSAEIQPYSARALGEKLGSEARLTTLNAKTLELIRHPDLRSVADVLPANVLDDMRARAKADATAMRGSPTQQAAEEARVYGQLVREELKARKLELLLGDVDEPGVGEFNPGRKVEFSDVANDSLVLPEGVKAKLVPHSIGKDMNIVMRAMEKINRKFKGAVLPFSVRWQLGDLVGGAFMSAVGGGIPPWELIDGMRQIKKLDADGVEAVLNRPEFQDAGLNFEESKWMHETPDTPGPRTPIGKISRKSFQINAAINRYNRQGFLLAKLQRILDDRGLSLEGVQSSGAWDDPVVQESITKAVDNANEVMGTFDEMTPFERRVVRNVFPFWAWNRHITQLAFRTAIDNPARMLWTMRLGSYGTDPDMELPSWLKGSIPAGGQLIPTNFLNPFNDVAGGSIYTPHGAIRAMSPGLRMGAYALGLDPSKGLAMTSQRYDGGSLDELGRETPNMLDPSTLLYQAIRTVPLGRAALDIAPTAEIGGIGLGPHPRYGSGELMVNRSGKPIDSNPRWRSAAGVIGLPLPTAQSEVEPILAAAAKRRQLAARRAANVVGYRP